MLGTALALRQAGNGPLKGVIEHPVTGHAQIERFLTPLIRGMSRLLHRT